MLLVLMMLLMWIKQYGVLFEKGWVINIVKGYWSITIMKSKHRCGTNFSTFFISCNMLCMDNEASSLYWPAYIDTSTKL